LPAIYAYHIGVDSLILGIDAAWTTTSSSGIALVLVTTGHTPQLLRVARTCSEFTSDRILEARDWLSTPLPGGPLKIDQLLNTIEKNACALPSVIVLDIPLSPLPICGRRTADNAISKAYAKQWAGTHTPSKARPGPVSAALYRQLTGAGYSWVDVFKPRHLSEHIRYFFETYPHPVIVDMLGLEKRLCYKVAKRGRYWPNLTPDERWRNVASELDRLHSVLASRIGGLADKMPKACAILSAVPKSKGVVFKGIEDVLDAVVCASVGCEFLAGRVVAFGDQYSAIWVPHHSKKEPPWKASYTTGVREPD
jgi:predicted RNase H-like nuclease